MIKQSGSFLCIDSHTGGEPTRTVIRDLPEMKLKGTQYQKNHITHCHFKDCKPVEGGRDGMNGGYEMQNFGEGIIDFVWIMKKLDEIGYDEDIALEYEMHDVLAEKAIKIFYTDFLSLFQ